MSFLKTLNLISSRLGQFWTDEINALFSRKKLKAFSLSLFLKSCIVLGVVLFGLWMCNESINSTELGGFIGMVIRVTVISLLILLALALITYRLIEAIQVKGIFASSVQLLCTGYFLKQFFVAVNSMLLMLPIIYHEFPVYKPVNSHTRNLSLESLPKALEDALYEESKKYEEYPFASYLSYYLIHGDFYYLSDYRSFKKLKIEQLSRNAFSRF